MSEQENQPPASPKRRRTPRAKAGSMNQPAQQAGAELPASPPASLSSAASAEPPVGEKWGEFPLVERQAELKRMLEAWDQEKDHGDRPGPFAIVNLTGADVYWLAASTVGKGDMGVGSKKFPFTFDLSNLLLEGAILYGAYLEDASLSEAHLKGADLRGAHLEGAILGRTDLKSANLHGAHLEGAILSGAHLEGADLGGAYLKGADLSGAHLKGANLYKAHLEGAHMSWAHLEGASLSEAHLEGTFLSDAHLEGTSLSDAHLEGAILGRTHLEGAILGRTHLEGVDLREGRLTRQVDLREATFDVKTQLAETHLDATLRTADAVWNGVPLTRVNWEQVPRLGDEAVARQAFRSDGWRKGKYERLVEFEAAARAYRQLAVALRSQGITEEADRFTYRALIMQRKALWWQIRNWKFRKLGSYLLSHFLALLTGYGFRLWRIIIAYLALILVFAGAYWSLDLQTPHIYTFWQALILSVTAFHGRVFSNPFLLTEPQIVVTAIEAIFGLVIEGVFIAMLTQRFFNR